MSAPLPISQFVGSLGLFSFLLNLNQSGVEVEVGRVLGKRSVLLSLLEMSSCSRALVRSAKGSCLNLSLALSSGVQPHEEHFLSGVLGPLEVSFLLQPAP